MVPDFNECRRLLIRHQVPEHIVSHSLQVARVALCLGKALSRRGVFIDQGILLSGGLLHDIAKIESINNGRDHAELGAEWLHNYGFPAVAEVVGSHVRIKTDLNGPICAKEIVYYADKRVCHETIVSVQERISDLYERYGKDSYARGLLHDMEVVTLAIEKKIFGELDFFPADIINRCQPLGDNGKW